MPFCGIYNLFISFYSFFMGSRKKKAIILPLCMVFLPFFCCGEVNLILWVSTNMVTTNEFRNFYVLVHKKHFCVTTFEDPYFFPFPIRAAILGVRVCVCILWSVYYVKDTFYYLWGDEKNRILLPKKKKLCNFIVWCVQRYQKCIFYTSLKIVFY